jgi:small subunit ribosomal protein S1
VSTMEREDEDFASLLAEYEQSQPAEQRRDLPQVGDTIRGRVVSIGSDTVFVALGAKAEAVLGREEVIDADGTLRVAIGDVIEARVAEIRGGQVVLRTMLGRGPDARAELAQAHEHQIPVEGVVSAIIKGGVEVQVGGVRGFCPISQLSDRFIEDPTVFVGQRLTFRIIRFEAGRGQSANIVLSRRALLEEESAAKAAETRERLVPGAVMTGTVRSIKGYGAFVDLGGIEGMLHISELGHSRVEHPSEVLSEGQEVEVQVIKIEKTGDPKRPEKIALSLKSLAHDPWDQVAARFTEGIRTRGTVTRVQPYGAFVELAPGIEGLIHVSELGAGRRVSHAREVVSEGQEVEVVVLGVDAQRRRISLSMGAVQAQEEAAEVAAYAPPARTGFGTLGDLLKPKR